MQTNPESAAVEAVAIVCDWRDANPFPHFIEAEVNGRSVSLEWRDRPDGLKELIFPTYTKASAVGQSSLTERVAVLTAHRACHSAEHDPPNGRIHGYCIVCGIPFPCEYVGEPPHKDQSALDALRGEVAALEDRCTMFSGAVHVERRRADAAERRVEELEAAAFAARGRLIYLNSLTGEKIDADIIGKINAAITKESP